MTPTDDRSKAPKRRRRSSSRPGRGAPPGGGSFLVRLGIAALVFAVGYRLFMGLDGGERVAYSEFLARVESDRVEAVTLEGQELRGEMRPTGGEGGEGEAPGGAEPRVIVTHVPAQGDDELLPMLRAHDVVVRVVPESGWSWWLVAVLTLPMVLLGIMIFGAVRNVRGQGQRLMSIGQSRAKRAESTAETTTYDDVAGAEGPKAELAEIADYLADPKRFQRLGGRPPKGILLVGPPGTGKTLLARATAGEAGVPFFHITGSDFMEMFVGVGASRVRSLFEEARREAPSIVFIDELDSIGRRRGTGLGGGHDEREQTLNQLLSELDGFTTHEGVIVLSATNRPDILDPALLRPGRFDRHVTVPLPTVRSRRAILEIHAAHKPFADDVKLDEIAHTTPGFSGAELENLLNEAALIAAKRRREEITLADVEEARDKLILGLEREGLVLTDGEKRLIAYHEAGHALVSVLVGSDDVVQKISIVPRGRSMGATQMLPTRERYVSSEALLRDQLAVLMGGRVAEELALETTTTGAEDDLKRVAKIARHMVLDWGMGEDMRNVALGEEEGEVMLGEKLTRRANFGDRTASRIDDAIGAIITDVHARTTELVTANREMLDRIVERLVEDEELGGDELRAIVGERDEGGEVAAHAVDAASRRG